MRKVPLAVAAFAIVLPLLAACGDDSDSDTPATTAVAAETTGAATTAAAAATTAAAAAATTAAAAGITPGEDADVDAVVLAYGSVFDSTVPFTDKAVFLVDADALQPTAEAYAAAAQGFGGIRLEPTAVVINGTDADVTYDVYFGTTKQYGDLTGTAVNDAGTWKVSREEFCLFMASARTPCPS